MGRIKIGVLCTTDCSREHLELLDKCGVEALLIDRVEKLSDFQGLIIEKINADLYCSLKNQHFEYLINKTPILAFSAGVSQLAKKSRQKQNSLDLMDIKVNNLNMNMKTNIFIPAISAQEIQVIFQEAPIIEQVAPNVGILYQFHDQHIVFVRQGVFFACTFNPRLTKDVRIYQYFIEIIKNIDN